jgi:hypothetical protein
MTPSSFVRSSGIAAIGAGLGYIGTAALDLLQPQTSIFTRPTDYAIEALFVVALLLTLVGYAGIHARHGGRGGRFEAESFRAALVGTTGIAVPAFATLLAGREILGPIFLLGVLIALIGNICFGISVLRAGVLPRWFGWALMLGLPISIPLDALGGGLVLGAVWIALGVVLMAERQLLVHRRAT